MRSLKMKSIRILLNITHACNMACGYCYYQSDMKSNPGNMPIDVVEAVIRNAGESSFEEINFAFHGGEPLVRSIDYLNQVLDFQEKYLKHKKYTNSIQTNGTLLSDEVIDLFIKQNVHIGISLDGPSKIQNYHRPFIDGIGTYEIIVQNIRKLEQRKVPIGILSVCSDEILEDIDAYYAFFNDFENIYSIDILAPEIDEHNPILSEGNYSKIIISLFDKWFYDSNCSFNITTLSVIVTGFVLSGITSCTFMKNCVNENCMVSVSPNGEIVCCDNDTTIILGNILDDSLDYTIYENPIKKKQSKIEDERVEKCIFCKWYNYCHGGCKSLCNEDNQNTYCNDLKQIFSYISNVLEGMNLYQNDNLTERDIECVPNHVLRSKLKEMYRK